MPNTPENPQNEAVKPPSLPFTQHVRSMLKNRPVHLTLKSLAASCNCSTEWLSKFLNDANDSRDPGVKKMIRLYNLLSDTPLQY